MAGGRDYHTLRSVGQQSSTITRPCFICRGGLKGRKYCYFCGNTKDLGGGLPQGDPYRSTADVTRCLGAPVKLERGTEYEIVVEIAKGKEKTIRGVCEGTRGPYAVVNGHNIHLLEITRMEVVQ